MTIDPGIHEANRAATSRIRAMAALTDEQLRTPVGEHWTVGIALAHLAFWDRRVLDVLDRTERAGTVEAPEIDVVANDLALPFWAAVPPRDAVRLAGASAEALDARLASLAPDLLAAVDALNPRWVRRSLHRGEHLEEVDRALGR